MEHYYAHYIKHKLLCRTVFYLEQFYIAQLSFQQFSRPYHINTEVSRASSH